MKRTLGAEVDLFEADKCASAFERRLLAIVLVGVLSFGFVWSFSGKTAAYSKSCEIYGAAMDSTCDSNGKLLPRKLWSGEVTK
ncbi:hypothetical protein AB6Q56_07750 [Dechloromonas sp. ARDL1]|uniref:hypothetical protein n=1 Tax=Dechloromonas sp. ARDL1 TaxID=3322121 RepID=UPI003DA77118